MRYRLTGLDCAHCAARIEDALHQVEGLEDISVNFAARTVDIPAGLAGRAREVVGRIDPDVRLEKAPAGPATAPVAETPRADIRPVVAAGILLAVGTGLHRFLHDTPYALAEFAVLLTAYALVGRTVVYKALRGLVRGQVLDENFLMTVATAGAIAIHQLPEAVAVMLFYTVGEHFQDRAVERSRRSVSALLDVRPDYANLRSDSGTRRVSPEEVRVGEVIVVRPGERVPLDGQVIDGASYMDTSALTGESVPRKVEVGEEVLAGMVNGEGVLTVRVTRPFAQSSVSRILELVETAAARKAPAERFITRFARHYTPAVVGAAAGLAVAPPLLLPGATFAEWVYRALVLLVISCPCALVVSIPLGYFGGVGGASRQGILVKGANYLDVLTRLDTVVFDKTGTLTRGVFRVAEVAPAGGFSREEVLALAAAAEVHSSHPIAHSIRRAHAEARAGEGREVSENDVESYREIRGHGVRARVKGRRVLVGNSRLLDREGIGHPETDASGTVVHVAVDGAYAGSIAISDEVKPDAARAVRRLKELGVRRTVMLTGDEESVAAGVAAEVGLDEYHAELLPEDKVRILEEIQESLARERAGDGSPGPATGRPRWRRRPERRVAFVGDGINDAPVLTRADVGVAMGALGSDAAIEAADVVLMEDAPSKLATAVEVARHTRRVVAQNVALALGVKGLFLLLGTVGVATIWEAVFADVGVALLAILNATRTLYYRRRPA